ncbi:hypothetical protein [Cytobacillus oceanisediminis]|uniref:hypothetical protein n=1 Tax=Cytobacillus oceanisediminis TaxID=665099 RepID=UPI002041DA4F|nr:hypothetical protein [Cytobacillus oceanisediminis]MCM3530143.1 hypothetical protein [Cytobacillus oceanisediminis]USK42222.1 hypothetical protein LIT27_16415 [Cytobacillus oceanisediminis]
MGKNLVFHIPTYTKVNSTFPKPSNDNYDYWVPLINYYLPKSDTIEIHCWNEEIEIIREIKCLNINMLEMQDEKITIFKEKKICTLSDYLFNKKLDQNDNFKWFTVNLICDGVTVFHSGHWGTEFFVPNAEERDILLIKNVIPPETNLHKY